MRRLTTRRDAWSRRAESAAVWLAVAGAALALLALGAVHVQVLVPVGALSLAAAGLALALGGRVPLPAWICIGAAGLSVLQALPLPAAWVGALSPHAAAVWRGATELAAPELAGSARLSVSPSATWVEAYRWLVYAAVFVAGDLIGARRGARFAVVTIFAIAVAAGVVTITHGVLGLESVYGLYEPRFATTRWHVGPLLNSNNFAGFMILGAFCAMGMLLSRRPPLPRWIPGVGIMLLVALMLISGSRAATLAFGACLFVYLLIEFTRRDQRRGQRTLVLSVAGVVVAGLTLALLGSTDRLSQLLLSGDTKKLTILGWTRQLLLDYPLAGVGRGAFEAAFPTYRGKGGNVLFAHAENFVVQYLSEWGLIGGAAILIGFVIALRPRRVVGAPTTLGAYFGFVALLLQNLVDLALEIPGVCIPLALLLGACAGQKATDSGGAPKPLPRPARVAFAPVAAGLALLAWTSGPDPVTRRDELREQLLAVKSGKKDSAEQQALSASIRRAVLSSPASPYFTLLGAIAATKFEQNPLPWVAATLDRDPLNGPAQLVAAHAVRRRGALHQALLHLRLAYENDPALTVAVAERALEWTQDPELLLRVVPAGARGAPLLSAMAGRVPGDHLATRERLLREVIARTPADARALYTLGSDLARAIKHDEARCGGEQRAACLTEVKALSERMRKAAPGEPNWVLLGARALELEQRWAEADRFLADHCGRVEPRTPCVEERLEALPHLADARALEAVIDELRQICGDAASCARVELGLATRFVRQGWRREALGPLRRAAELEPTAENWLKLASIAAEAGAVAEARRAVRRARQEQPGDATVARRAREIEQRIGLN